MSFCFISPSLCSYFLFVLLWKQTILELLVQKKLFKISNSKFEIFLNRDKSFIFFTTNFLYFILILIMFRRKKKFLEILSSKPKYFYEQSSHENEYRSLLQTSIRIMLIRVHIGIKKNTESQKENKIELLEVENFLKKLGISFENR